MRVPQLEGVDGCGLLVEPLDDLCLLVEPLDDLCGLHFLLAIQILVQLVLAQNLVPKEVASEPL